MWNRRKELTGAWEAGDPGEEMKERQAPQTRPGAGVNSPRAKGSHVTLSLSLHLFALLPPPKGDCNHPKQFPKLGCVTALDGKLKQMQIPGLQIS